MIGNNSCGVHGLLGGKVADNVESLEIALYDGTRMTVGRTGPAQLEAAIRAGGRVGEIYTGLARLRDRYAGLIREKFPRIPRRVSGYNLDELLDENSFNVARALVGSEGTCATVVSATLNLTASPPFRVLTALAFDDAFLAADAVPRTLEFGPIGLEGFDGLLLDFMRRKHLAVDDVALLPPGGGFLLVEMGAWSAEEAQAKAEALVRSVHTWPEAPVACIYSMRAVSRLSAPRFLSPASLRALRVGTMPAFPPRISVLICADSRPSWASMATAARSTVTTGRAASTCASTSISAPSRVCASSANSSTAPPIWRSASAVP
jgi:FAD/FMN-containing dehydrogenase